MHCRYCGWVAQKRLHIRLYNWYLVYRLPKRWIGWLGKQVSWKPTLSLLREWKNILSLKKRCVIDCVLCNLINSRKNWWWRIDIDESIVSREILCVDFLNFLKACQVQINLGRTFGDSLSFNTRTDQSWRLCHIRPAKDMFDGCLVANFMLKRTMRYSQALSNLELLLVWSERGRIEYWSAKMFPFQYTRLSGC